MTSNHTARTGLYLMVLFILLESCGTTTTLKRIERKLNETKPCVIQTVNEPVKE